jgi:hypothetical protein
MHDFSSSLNITLNVSDGLSVHHQESHCTHNVRYMSYRLCWLLASGPEDPLASSQHSLYDIYLKLYVQYRTPDDGRKDRPKHLELYSINSKNCASSWFYYRNVTSVFVLFHLEWYTCFSYTKINHPYSLPQSDKTILSTFADDTAIFTTDPDPTQTSANLQGHLLEIITWTRRWKLKINESKSSHISLWDEDNAPQWT